MAHLIHVGCVADDFTGASDIASFLEQAGAHCLLINGIPDSCEISSDYDAVVIALKTRSISPQQAVEATLKSFNWLLSQGVNTLYLKYCSTFDCTPSGNIGPVLDAVMEKYNIPYTLLCPSLPVNGRTVKEGILYVNDIPLAETHMKNHPVNPMLDSRIVELMKPQSRYPSFVKTAKELPCSQQTLTALTDENKHFYMVPDYITDQDGAKIAEYFHDLKLYSGGSALLAEIYKRLIKTSETSTENAYKSAKNKRSNCDDEIKRSIILSGSLSAATSAQIAEYLSSGAKSVRLYPDKLIEGSQDIDEIWSFVQNSPHDAVLIYSCRDDNPTGIYSQDQMSAALESTVARLGELAIEHSFSNIIVAGGETSGAVAEAMDCRMFAIGPPIAPGVPILYPINYSGMGLALKSGNFGQEDFFRRALDLMSI